MTMPVAAPPTDNKLRVHYSSLDASEHIAAYLMSPDSADLRKSLGIRKPKNEEAALDVIWRNPDWFDVDYRDFHETCLSALEELIDRIDPEEHGLFWVRGFAMGWRKRDGYQIVRMSEARKEKHPLYDNVDKARHLLEKTLPDTDCTWEAEWDPATPHEFSMRISHHDAPTGEGRLVSVLLPEAYDDSVYEPIFVDAYDVRDVVLWEARQWLANAEADQDLGDAEKRAAENALVDVREAFDRKFFGTTEEL